MSFEGELAKVRREAEEARLLALVALVYATYKPRKPTLSERIWNLF